MPYSDPNAVEEDRRLQADPELDLSEGRATTAQKAFTAIAAIAVITLVLYGLTHQRDDTQQETANAPAAQTTGAAPPGNAQDSQKQQANQAQGSDQQKQPQQGNNQGAQENKPQGQAQGNQGPGQAAPPTTTGAAPKPPAGAPESGPGAPEKQKK